MTTNGAGIFGVGFTVLLATLVACSSSDSGGTNKATGTGGRKGTGGSGSGATSGSGGSGTGGGGLGCQSTGCTTDQVCHPISFTCVTPGGSCSGQTDCASGMYCDVASGTCLPGVTGSPCDSDANCSAGTCVSGVCGCGGISREQELISGPLDIYFIFDRTASMGEDCAYTPGGTPQVNSKACFATYAMSDYLINTTPSVDTRLAFQFMSLDANDCDGTPYATPLVPLTQLPMPATDPLIQAISDETFVGGIGTHIEGALRGMATFTTNNRTQGREMIGVLMTDGDPNGCDENIGDLRQIIADHLANDGIRTFVIGMEGATDSNLEELALAGGADPHSDWCGSVQAPCHYWNVGNGSGQAISSALSAIIQQASPLPCHFDVIDLTPPAGETLDFSKINVQLTDSGGNTTIIGQVPDPTTCPTDQPAWYYDNPNAPTTINLCDNACNLATNASNGSHLSVLVGCNTQMIIR